MASRVRRYSEHGKGNTEKHAKWSKNGQVCDKSEMAHGEALHPRASLRTPIADTLSTAGVFSMPVLNSSSTDLAAISISTLIADAKRSRPPLWRVHPGVSPQAIASSWAYFRVPTNSVQRPRIVAPQFKGTPALPTSPVSRCRWRRAIAHGQPVDLAPLQQQSSVLV